MHDMLSACNLCVIIALQQQRQQRHIIAAETPQLTVDVMLTGEAATTTLHTSTDTAVRMFLTMRGALLLKVGLGVFMLGTWILFSWSSSLAWCCLRSSICSKHTK